MICDLEDFKSIFKTSIPLGKFFRGYFTMSAFTFGLISTTGFFTILLDENSRNNYGKRTWNLMTYSSSYGICWPYFYYSIWTNPQQMIKNIVGENKNTCLDNTKKITTFKADL